MPQKVSDIISFFSEAKLEIVSFFIALFVPTIPGLMFIGLLIFADTFTGIWKTVKNKGWKSVNSRPLSDGLLPKLTMYPLILLVASGCKHIFPDIPFIRASIFLIMCIEIKSLTENINVILKINFFNFIKIYLEKGRKGIVEEMSKNNTKENDN